MADIVKSNRDLIDQSLLDDNDIFMIMTMTLLVMVLAKITAVVSYVQDVRPQGFVEAHNLEVSPTVQEFAFSNVLQGMVIQNDGSVSVFVKVNSSNNNPSEIKPGEVIPINFDVHVIERIYYYTLVGGVSRIRIDGIY